MKRFIASVLIFSTVFLCAGNLFAKKKCESNKNPTPAIYEATFVESSGTSEVMIKASGVGCSMEEAAKEAKKTAIWFVLESGDQPILKSDAEKTKAYGFEVKMYQNPEKYIRWTSDIKSKSKTGDKTKVTYLFRIDTAMLRQELAAGGVIATMEEVGEEIGLPTISVFADKGGDYAKTAVAVIQEYFQDNDLEVYKASQGAAVDKIVNKISMLEGAETDPMHDMALSLGTDVYAKVNYSESRGGIGSKASVVVEVFETASGKMLGSTTGYSAERKVTDKNALIQEAVNDASSKVLSQIKKEWMKMAKSGKPFKITVLSSSSDGAAVDEAVYGALKKLTKKPIKRTAGGKSTFTYIAYIKNFSNAYELFQAVKKGYSGPGQLEKVSDSGSFLVFKAAGSGEIELVIE